MNNRLLQLLKDNRKTEGRRFEARALESEAGEGFELLLYDTIASDETEAEWWGGVSPEAFRRALAEAGGAPVALRINSPGGSVFGGRAMERAVRDYKGAVTVHIDGLAASAATLPAIAGAQMLMPAGAMFMIHNAWTLSIGNSSDMRKQADLLDKIDSELADTYAAKTGKPAAQIRQWMVAETWFTSKEAAEVGFAAADESPKASAGPVWSLQALMSRADVSRPEPEHKPRARVPLLRIS